MKYRRKKRPKKKQRRGIYLLPNLFTAFCLFSGFYAILAVMEGRFEVAALAIFLSAVLDGLDGRIARLTQTSSHFGIEFDSLADLIAFGVAPGLLAFEWALRPFGRLGWLAAFMYVICGALRLARFNVQANNPEPQYFKGLPIPGAACFIAAVSFFTPTFSIIQEHTAELIIVSTYVLSFLMVSTIRYPSMKKWEVRNRRPFNVLVWVILMSLVVAYKPRVMLFFMIFVYILSGPAMILFRLLHSRHSAGEPVLAGGLSLEEKPKSPETKK